MVEPLRTFQIYNGLKLHFKSKNYSVAKYGYGANKFNAKVLSERNDRYMFEKVGREFLTEERLKNYLAINLFYDPDIWIGSVLEEQNKNRYLKFKSFNDAKSYHVLEDMKYLISKYGTFVSSLKQGGIVNEVMRFNIHPGSVVILNRLFGINDIVSEHCNNIIWNQVEQRINKFDCFVTVPDVDFYETLKDQIRTLLNKDNQV